MVRLLLLVLLWLAMYRVRVRSGWRGVWRQRLLLMRIMLMVLLWLVVMILQPLKRIGGSSKELELSCAVCAIAAAVRNILRRGRARIEPHMGHCAIPCKWRSVGTNIEGHG